MLVRTRYFLVGSALILVVGLAAGLVAYYSGSLPLRASTIGPAELTYLPSQTSGVAFADLRDIMDSEFHRKLRAMLPVGAGKHELLTETGINMEEDIDSVLAGLSATEGDEPPLILLRGRFDTDRIRSVATSHGATVEQYQDRTLVIFPEAQRHRPALAFLESGLIGLGDAAALRRAIDAAVGRASIVERPEVMKLVADVDGGGNAWVIGRLDQLAENRAVPDQLTRMLPSVQWVSATFDVGQAVHGRLRADAADEAAGEQLRSVVNGAIAAGKMVSASDPRLAAVLQSVRTAGAGPTVEVTFTVPSEMLDLIHPPATQPSPEAR
jgi:hypothetical protein